MQTIEGRVQGLNSNGVSKFLGLPYAQPPVGKLRWQPPQTPAAWNNVLQAKNFAPICALTTTLGVFSGPRNDNEDCLYLNVFTPDVKPSQRLPVIVFIHGGGNYDGETPGYDGSKLAVHGKVIVVTVAYRLNLMGFLAHPALNSEGHRSGNYGLLDQQAALKWVQRNIAAFGGDRNNVTLAGQSAGAINTMMHLVSPPAAGLFHRAICQSSCLANFPLISREVAESKAVAFAVAAGCGSGAGPGVAQCLRHIPAAKVLELAGTESTFTQYVTGFMVDGQVVPDQPITLVQKGQFHHVPLMSGGTTDEWNFALAIQAYFSNTNNALRTAPTADQYVNYVENTFVPPVYAEQTAPKVMQLYPLSSFKSPQQALNRVASDAQRLCNLRLGAKVFAAQVPVYAYEFADATAPSYFPDMPGMELGAFHTADLQYLFPLWHGGPLGIEKPLNQQQVKLSDQMVSAWANFARTGNPNGTGNSPWPRFTSDAGASAWMIQDLPRGSSIADAEYSARHHCDFWDSVGPKP
ncbi:carboxylesterase family protein [Variovorax paradoxus]|nr:carboxylesterase family protein [Variovorax paradoxus]